MVVFPIGTRQKLLLEFFKLSKANALSGIFYGADVPTLSRQEAPPVNV